MATAAELRETSPGRARVLLELLEYAGWKVTKLLNVIEPEHRHEDIEVIFFGHKAGTRASAEPQPHTALIPQDEHGEVVVLDRVL